MNRFLESSPKAVVEWPVPITRSAHLNKTKRLTVPDELWEALSVAELRNVGYTKVDQLNLFCEVVTCDLKSMTDKSALLLKFRNLLAARPTGVGALDATFVVEMDRLQLLIDCDAAPLPELESVVALTKKQKDRGALLDCLAIFPMGRDMIKHAELSLADRLRASASTAKLIEMKEKLEKRILDDSNDGRILFLGRAFGAAAKSLASTGFWEQPSKVPLFADMCELWERSCEMTLSEIKGLLSKASAAGTREAFEHMESSFSSLKGATFISCAFFRI